MSETFPDAAGGVPPRRPPSVDRILSSPALAAACRSHGRSRVKAWIQAQLAGWRRQGTLPDWAGDPAAYAVHMEAELGARRYRTVFNLTGTLIHTNLGRAPLNPDIWRELEALVCRPSNLEYDLAQGRRGKREQAVTDRLCALTGAEAACVVNNNAAALMLVLNSLALNLEVPVSRGELIEIGGSFRLPDIMARAGCRLREVGTTNRTHLRDYESAIGSDTALLLRIHPSNYEIRGFTHSVPLPQLAELGHHHDKPVYVDLGSGSLVDLTQFGLPPEPQPQHLLAQGADLVSISGDKLLGSVQAGIVLGRADLIDRLNGNPMKRALRLDKVALAYLERTLALYEQPEQLPEVLPYLRQLILPVSELHARGERLQSALAHALTGLQARLAASTCQIGSGALPDARLPSLALVLTPPPGRDEAHLAAACRALPTPVIGRMHQGELWLDLRAAEPEADLIAVLTLLEGEL